MGSPLADVLRGMLQPGGMSAPGRSAPAPQQNTGPLGSMLGRINQGIVDAGKPQSNYQQQPQATLNSGQPGAPAGIGHQFTPTAWTPPSEQRYSGPNPNTQLQQLMATRNPMNSAGHTLDWYKQNLPQLDWKSLGIDQMDLQMDPAARARAAQMAYDRGLGQP